MAETAAKPDMRTMLELISGQSLDSNFYQRPDASEIVSKASNVLYGDIGANLDTRDWGAIMKSADPYKAAQESLKSMYSDPTYLVKNAENLLTKGYLPEQADYTYQQMQGRVGSTYNPNWTAGSQFAGKVDTAGYLAGVTKAGNNPVATEAINNSYWKKYGGNPTLTRGGSIVNTGGSTVNTGSTNINIGSTNTSTATPTTTTTSTTVYGPDGRMYSSAASAIAAGVTNYTVTKPAGLIANADLMGSGGGGTASRGFMSDDTSTGNINPGGLIANQNAQLFNPVTQINLPTGVPNPFRT